MTELKDQLSWDEFLIHSKNQPNPINKVNEFNRLIAHTKNFFIISGYGAFTKGYMLIITKEFIPSFGLVSEENLDEVNFLVKQIQDINLKVFKRKSVIFEHGMCACIGGLDRAHLHIMTTHENSNSKTLKNSIDKVLFNRKAELNILNLKIQT